RCGAIDFWGGEGNDAFRQASRNRHRIATRSRRNGMIVRAGNPHVYPTDTLSGIVKVIAIVIVKNDARDERSIRRPRAEVLRDDLRAECHAACRFTPDVNPNSYLTVIAV